MSKNNFFVLLSLLPVLVSAANDWSTPCLHGSCSYDILSSESSMAGSMTINGSPNAISDITTAAGWETLNCTADAAAQDIRIVCSGDEASCSHLFQNGAEHTIVRLPPNCGASPFARVTQVVQSNDQSLPEHISSRIMRRDGTTPTVHALSFDTDFDQVPSSQHGNVSMLVFGSTIPGFNGNATITPAGSRRRSRIVNKRGVISSLLGDFNKTKSTDLPPINIDQKFNIFNTTLSCSANEEAKLSVDVEAKVNAQVTIGAVLAGSIIPPKITEFGLFADVSADLDGSLSIDANIAGEVGTGKIPLFSVGLPGLDIPEILSLGPTFNIDAEAKATIDLDVDMSIDLAYGVSDLQLFFPPSSGQTSSANVSPKDTPLKLSASPDVSSNATLEAHLIPSLNFGLTVLKTSATVFLDLDTFAALDLGLEAGASASVDTSRATGASAQVGGCVGVNGGVSVNAGAEGSFFGLFDDSTQIPLFSKNFDFFKKCFTDSTATTSSASISTTSASSSDSASASSIDFPSSAVSGISESASGYVSQSAYTASASFTPSASSFEPSSSSTLTLSSAPIETSSTATASSSTIIIDSSVLSSATTTSSSSVATISAPSSKRLGRRRVPSTIQLAKRNFQCLAADVTAATSVVDQTLSSSSFTS